MSADEEPKMNGHNGGIDSDEVSLKPELDSIFYFNKPIILVRLDK